MTAAQVLNHCRALCVDIVLCGNGQIELTGPKEARDRVREFVRANKPALLRYLPRPRPEPMAVVSHCLRVRPGTTTTEAERQALAERCKALPDDGEVDRLLLQLFSCWRKGTVPSLTAFLATNQRRATA